MNAINNARQNKLCEEESFRFIDFIQKERKELGKSSKSLDWSKTDPLLHLDLKFQKSYVKSGITTIGSSKTKSS
jgi:hypothetical protein